MFTAFSFGTSVCFVNALIYGSMIEYENCEQSPLEKAKSVRRQDSNIPAHSPFSSFAMLRILRISRVGLRRGGLAMTIKEVLVTHAVQCILARN